MINPDMPDNSRYNEFAPYLRLWAAVMKQGIDLAALAYFRRGDSERPEYDLYWFESDSNEVGSFNWICDVLGYDPNTARYLAKSKFREIALAAHNRSKREAKARAEMDDSELSVVRKFPEHPQAKYPAAG